MSLRRWAQLASPWGEADDESGGPGAVAAQSLDLDVILDSPLSTYSTYRLMLTLVLSFWWLVATDVYVDIWAAGAPDMGLCTCETAAGHAVPFASFNYSKPSDNRHACHVCAELGGEPRCPADADPSTMAIDFGIYCERDWLLGLPPSFDMAGVFLGALAGGRISDRHGRRRTYVFSLCSFGLLYCLSATATSFASYCALKFFMGLCGSAGNVAAFTLASELVGPTLRTPLTIELWSYMFALMGIYTAAAAYAMRGAGTWRRYVLAMALPSVALLVTSLGMLPASPHRLQRKQKARALRATLRRLIGVRDPHRAVLERWELEQEGGGRTPPGLRPGASSRAQARAQEASSSRTKAGAGGHAHGGGGGEGARDRGGSFQLSAAEITEVVGVDAVMLERAFDVLDPVEPPPDHARDHARDRARDRAASPRPCRRNDYDDASSPPPGGASSSPPPPSPPPSPSPSSPPVARIVPSDKAGAAAGAPPGRPATGRPATGAGAGARGGGSGGAVAVLCSERARRRIMLAEMYIWAAVALSYYGLSFNAASLSDSPHLDFILSSLTELIATWFCARAMDSPRLGRRVFNTAMMTTLSVSLGLGALVTALARPLSLVGKFAALGAFNLIYVQAAELFPTAVRTTALGLCSASARVGSILAPPLGRSLGPRPSMVLISCTSLVAALLCWGVVPETLGKGLADADADADGEGEGEGDVGGNAGGTTGTRACAGHEGPSTRVSGEVGAAPPERTSGESPPPMC